jgi:DNA-binding PadR family transcriptional regulator
MGIQNKKESRRKLQRQTKSGRARKVYTITKKGKKYLQSYYSILKAQMNEEDIK